MRARWLTLSLSLLAAPAAAPAAPASSTGAGSLTGTWEAVALLRGGRRTALPRGRRTRLALLAGGRLVAIERSRRGEDRRVGRWKADSGFLITQVGQRIDLARFRLKGATLELHRRGAAGKPGFTMILRRRGR